MVISIMDGQGSINIPAIPNDVPGINHRIGADGTYHHPFSGVATSDSSFESSPRQRPQPKSVARTRASNACNHCKARRRKCESDGGRAPCHTCVKAGEEYGCYFYAKGEQGNDRDARNPRIKGAKVKGKDSARTRRNALRQEDPWADLPPLEEMIDGVHQFFRHYFQLGFIPKDRYPETLRNDHRSVNVFLLLSILGVSARLSPPLKARYGGGLKASQFFMERAQKIAEREVYAEPLLERCQAYYVLSMAQQGEGLRHDSHMNMGIAIRMATDMELHVESSYRIENPTPESIIRAESARRTLWMLHSQDKLHSGPRSVESLSASDITTLLPCDEFDFAAGREPKIRAALSATPSGAEHPELVYHPESSLFASLMEAHLFWGSCMRRGHANYARTARLLGSEDGESDIMRRLRNWEDSLPKEHKFSRAMLRQHKAQGQDLAYLGVTMVVRLCNIVLRRPYLDDIIHLDKKDPQERPFYTNISQQLFQNVYDLFDQIEAQFTDRAPDENVGAQMAAFCVYSCALFSTYLCKYPHICPDTNISSAGPYMLDRTRRILVECQETWPLASNWLDSVDRFMSDQQATSPIHEGSMADGKGPMPNVLSLQRPSHPRQQQPPPQAPKQRPLPSQHPTPPASHEMSSSFSGSTYSHPTPTQQHHPIGPQAYLSPSHHHPQVPQAHHPEAYTPQPYMATDPSLMHAQAQVPQNMYYPRPPHPSEGMDLMMDPMEQSHQQPHLAGAYNMVHAPGIAPPDTIPFFPEALGPRTDGFDDQLQTFAGTGPHEIPHPNGWMNGFHGGPLG